MDAVALAMIEALPTTAPTVGWVTLAALPNNRSGTATSTDGNIIYSSHGFTPNAVQSAFFTVTQTGTVTLGSTNAPIARQGVAGAWCNGKHYAIGGLNSSNATTQTVEAYTPAGTNGASGVWTTLAVIGANNAYGSAAPIGNFIYLAGGQGTSAVSSASAGLLRYDTVNNVWSSLASMPAARAKGALAAVGTKLYYLGGADTSGTAQSTVFVFDTVAGTWSTGTAMSSTIAPGGYAPIINGTAYMYNGGGTVIVTYNTSTGASGTAVPLTASHGVFPGLVAIGSALYVVSGGDIANVDKLDVGAGTGFTTVVLGAKSLLNPLLAGVASILPTTPPTDTTGKAAYAQTVQTLKALAAL